MRNFERWLFVLGTACTAAGLAAGCGDDGGSSSGGNADTGLDESKLLSDVTDAEAATACERLAETYEDRLSPDELTRSICTLVAAGSTTTPEECEQARDTCIEQTGEQTAMDLGVAPECGGTNDLGECTGTVGDLENCVNDALDAIEAALTQFTCDDAGTVDMGDMEALGESGFEEPASCQALGCPEGSGPFGEEEP